MSELPAHVDQRFARPGSRSDRGNVSGHAVRAAGLVLAGSVLRLVLLGHLVACNKKEKSFRKLFFIGVKTTDKTPCMHNCTCSKIYEGVKEKIYP